MRWAARLTASRVAPVATDQMVAFERDERACPTGESVVVLDYVPIHHRIGMA
jgi:hypothetical protein